MKTGYEVLQLISTKRQKNKNMGIFGHRQRSKFQLLFKTFFVFFFLGSGSRIEM